MRRPNRHPYYMKMEDITNWSTSPSFLIYKNVDIVKTMNCRSGEIIYSGSDTGLAVQFAHDACPEFDIATGVGGGKIFVTEGIFYVSTKFTFDRPIHLQGCNRSYMTKLVLANNVDDDMLYVDAGTDPYHYSIRDIFFHGNKNNQSAGDYLVKIAAGYGCWQNVFVMYGYANGCWPGSKDNQLYNVYSEFNDLAGYFIGGENVQMISCTAWDNGNKGINMGSSLMRSSLFGCRIMLNGTQGIYCSGSDYINITGCYINENQEEGIILYNSTHVAISDCMIRDNSQKTDNGCDGIRLTGADNCTISNTHVIGTNLNGKDMKYCIEETGTDCDNNLIIGCDVSGAQTGQINLEGGSLSKVLHTTGYVTENGGTTAAIADGATIAHGCSLTPTHAYVTGSVAGEIITLTSIGAANLTVAIKNNAGGSGTNQAISWKAWCY